jgi:predicted component of type VI protein secretion system
MKKALLLVMTIAVLSACKSKITGTANTTKARIEVLASDEVDPALQTKAYDLGKRILNTCNTSKFKPFTTEEATDKVIQNTTLERLSSTCSKYLLKYGQFKDIKLVEVIKNNTDDSHIFRYKAEYQRKFTQKELQVTLNNENKVSAIKSTDWTDVYVP